jgi:hypothetical protein
VRFFVCLHYILTLKFEWKRLFETMEPAEPLAAGVARVIAAFFVPDANKPFCRQEARK